MQRLLAANPIKLETKLYFNGVADWLAKWVRVHQLTWNATAAIPYLVSNCVQKLSVM